VISVPRVRGGYPAEKPREVADVLIGQSSTAGEIVADPFMGSGSVGVAALQRGCRFLGNDLNPEAVQFARQRLAALDRADLTSHSSTTPDAEPVQADLLSVPERR
jgi:site-specific DNA-methyltransferase (adenine-specific)